MVRYHKCLDQFYSCSLLQDFKENHLKVVDLKSADLVGASVKHLLKDDDTGEEIWWDTEVVDIDLSSKNLENPFFSFIIPMKRNMKLKSVQVLRMSSLK